MPSHNPKFEGNKKVTRKRAGKGKKIVPPKTAGASRRKAPFRLEVGKTYITRDGQASGKLTETPGDWVSARDGFVFHSKKLRMTFLRNGRWWFPPEKSKNDLVREAKPPRASGARGSKSSPKPSKSKRVKKGKGK